MEAKHVSDSLTEQVQILMPSHINGADRYSEASWSNGLTLLPRSLPVGIPDVM
jgi:hypothetical protein